MRVFHYLSVCVHVNIDWYKLFMWHNYARIRFWFVVLPRRYWTGVIKVICFGSFFYFFLFFFSHQIWSIVELTFCIFITTIIAIFDRKILCCIHVCACVYVFISQIHIFIGWVYCLLLISFRMISTMCIFWFFLVMKFY